MCNRGILSVFDKWYISIIRFFQLSLNKITKEFHSETSMKHAFLFFVSLYLYQREFHSDCGTDYDLNQEKIPSDDSSFKLDAAIRRGLNCNV